MGLRVSVLVGPRMTLRFSVWADGVHHDRFDNGLGWMFYGWLQFSVAVDGGIGVDAFFAIQSELIGRLRSLCVYAYMHVCNVCIRMYMYKMNNGLGIFDFHRPSATHLSVAGTCSTSLLQAFCSTSSSLLVPAMAPSMLPSSLSALF